MLLLKGCSYVYTGEDLYRDVDIVIDDDGIVKDLGYDLRCTYSNTEVLDCRHRVLLPTLSNLHLHIVSTDEFIDKNCDDVELNLLKLYRTKDFSNEDLKDIIEIMVKEGIDEIALFAPIDISRIEELAKTGIMIYSGSIAIVHHGVELIPPIDYKPSYKSIVKVLNIVFDPDISLEGLRELKQILESLDYDLAFIHLGSRKIVFTFRKRFSVFPIEWFYRNELLSHKIVVVHGYWITNWELDAIKKHNSFVVVTPQATLLNVCGSFTPIKELMLDQHIGIGTDIYTSLKRELMALIYMYRYSYWDTHFDELKAFNIATISLVRRARKTIGLGSKAHILITRMNKAMSFRNARQIVKAYIENLLIPEKLILGNNTVELS